MLEISFGKLLIIFIVALIVLGPKKATEAAHSFGFWLGKIKNHLNNIKNNISIEKNFGNTIDDFKKELKLFKDIENDIKNEIDFIHNHNVYDCETIKIREVSKIKKSKIKVANQKTTRIGKLRRKKQTLK